MVFVSGKLNNKFLRKFQNFEFFFYKVFLCQPHHVKRFLIGLNVCRQGRSRSVKYGLQWLYTALLDTVDCIGTR